MGEKSPFLYNILIGSQTQWVNIWIERKLPECPLTEWSNAIYEIFQSLSTIKPGDNLVIEV